MPFYKETPEIKLAPQAREEHRSHHLPPRKGPQAGPGHASTLVTVGSQHEPSCELHGGWFTLPCTCTHSHSYSHTRGRHTRTHTRGRGQGSGHGPKQVRTTNQINCPEHTGPWATAAAPPAGVRTHRRGPQPTFQVVFCLLTKLTSSSDRGGKYRLLRALVSTSRQLRVAKSRHILETGSEIHLERKGHETSVRFFLQLKCSTHTRRHLRMHRSGGLVPSSLRRLPPHAPWSPLLETGGRQSACRDLGTCGLSCLVSESQPVPTAHRTARWTECLCPLPTN